MSRFALAAVLALGLSACSDDPDEVTPDSGTKVDAGTDSGTDSGTDAGVDAGPGDDAGVDAGPGDDAGVDAGPGDDAGVDAGPGDAGTDAGPGSSGGSGKLPSMTTGGTVRTDAGTLPYSVAKVGATEVKIIEPRAGTASQPMRLAIYLHGDGAATYNGSNPRSLFDIGGWTYGHNTLYVSARAPNGCAWWIPPEPVSTDCTNNPPREVRDLEGRNAEQLANLIEALRRGWNIQDGPILFGGSSGGSIELTASFLPRYGDRYPGIYALSCGGEKPWSGTLEWDATDPTLRAGTRFYFTYGDKDFLYNDIQEAKAYFGGYAFPVNDKVIANAEHCAFAQVGRVAEVWEEATSQP
jgi:hypothetical protein